MKLCNAKLRHTHYSFLDNFYSSAENMVERGAVETFRKCLLVHGRANKEKLERGTMEPWNNGGTVERWRKWWEMERKT